jgi:pyruvate/2-oxoglutarate dehydrogenase complex dihydrolipoamide acyltransferase (E2) component
MPQDVIMPKLDLAMTEGTVLEWVKKDGEEVKKGEVIAIIETAKATAEIEAPASGILHVLKPAGSVVPVLEKIAYIVEPGEELPSEVKPPEVVERVKASPQAKKIAKEYNIDLSKVKGTGPGGMITKEDVLSYIQKISPPPIETAETTKLREEVVKPAAPEGEEEIIPLTGWRKIMCERMSYSLRTAAQITTIAEVDATEMVNLRAKLKNEGLDITYTAFIVKAVTKALKEFPILNSSLVDDKIVVKKYYNIGIAVDREEGGLVVPVIHHADKLSLAEIAQRINELAQKAREGKLSIQDVTGGTFTISNVGMFGGIMNTPIINPPESAILGVGAIVKRPVVRDDQITIRSMMYLCLTYDHRIIQGGQAVRFLQRVRYFIENPQLLLT